MKITKLVLENFRIHRDSTLDIGDASFVVIRGRNFAGKSTIGQAVSMCLTPSTTGLDPQGRDFISKIKRGTAKAVITADIRTKSHLLRRTTTLSSNSSGRTRQSACLSDPDWNPAPFDRKLDANRAALTVVLNTDAFLRMDEKEQKNLLASLALPARYDFNREIVEAVEQVLAMDAPRFDGEPFAVINQAYKKLFDERQIVNRQVRDFVLPEELLVPAGVDSRSLQEQITSLRVERREKQKQRDQGVTEASKEEVARASAKAKAQSHQDEIVKEEHRAEAIRAFLLPEERLAYLRRVATGKAELDRLTKEKQGIEGMIDDYLRELGRLEEIADAGTKCPTCDQVIDQQKLTEMSTRLAVALKDVKDQNNLLHTKIMAMGEVVEAVEAIEKNDGALRELEAIASRVAEKQRLLDEAQKKIPEPVLFDFAPYDQSLAEIDAEVERLTAQLRPVITAEERLTEIGIKRGQLNALKERAALLDRLVKYFGPDGIKAKLIGEYIGGFEHKINEVMSAWGYSCALSIEPYSFDVTNGRGDVIPVRELSGAERIMFSLAFQCAVSWTASIGLVVIDEIAMLLPELRPVLNRRLYEMIQQGYLEQVILLVADSSEQVPSLAGAAFFAVEDGVVRPLHRKTVLPVAGSQPLPVSA